MLAVTLLEDTIGNEPGGIKPRGSVQCALKTDGGWGIGRSNGTRP